jgi:pimeloyl-ACP methyl ester carboxylesterase
MAGPDYSRRPFLLAMGLGLGALPMAAQAGIQADVQAGPVMRPTPPARENDPLTVTYGEMPVANTRVFYRAAGPAEAPVVLLLHGFPTSSHMFRNLMPLLADRYRVIAPDLPGFGNTAALPPPGFRYTFDHLAEVIEGFIDVMDLRSYALYVFDYGAPTGLRVAMRRPERVTAIVTQNGNAYAEGLSAAWEPWRDYWRNPTLENREMCRDSLSDEAIRYRYMQGAPAHLVSPDGYTLDMFYMRRPYAEDIQLDLILDYRGNVDLYPQFQQYFREHRPPLLAVWGKNDPFFVPPGAEAYKRDLPEAEVHFLDTGHFALETHYAEIAGRMRGFLGAKLV